MNSCLIGGPIDQQLPFGNDRVRVFSANGPNSLQAIVTQGLTLGAHLEFLHVDTDATISYVLKPLVAPAGPNGYYVQPDDYNAGANNKHWALAKLSKDGAIGIFNADIDGGAGGWNIAAATNELAPQLNLDNAANRIVEASDLT